MAETTEELRRLERQITESPGMEPISVSAFKPLALYDDELDCVRVLIRDCSITERRVNAFLAIYEDNYPAPGVLLHVGFAIKGVKHFLNQHDIPLDGTFTVVELLDRITKYSPEEFVNVVIEGIAKPILTKLHNDSIVIPQTA